MTKQSSRPRGNLTVAAAQVSMPAGAEPNYQPSHQSNTWSMKQQHHIYHVSIAYGVFSPGVSPQCRRPVGITHLWLHCWQAKHSRW